MRISLLFKFHSIVFSILEISGFTTFFYIIWIIEVHNFRRNKWIRLIKDLIQDVGKIGPLFEFHSVVFSILEISGFTSFFYTDLNVIWIIEVHNFRTYK